MKKKKTPIRLSNKAVTALKNSYATEYKARVNNLENIKEYSFSILLYWNRIEAILKVLQYYKHIDKDYPDKLNFINRRWNILKNIYDSNNSYYEKILGKGAKTSGCLWHTRDRITHANHNVEVNEYYEYKTAATSVINQLVTNLPESYDLAHKEFLQHKKEKQQTGKS